MGPAAAALHPPGGIFSSLPSPVVEVAIQALHYNFVEDKDSLLCTICQVMMPLDYLSRKYLVNMHFIRNV